MVWCFRVEDLHRQTSPRPCVLGLGPRRLSLALKPGERLRPLHFLALGIGGIIPGRGKAAAGEATRSPACPSRYTLKPMSTPTPTPQRRIPSPRPGA